MKRFPSAEIENLFKRDGVFPAFAACHTEGMQRRRLFRRIRPLPNHYNFLRRNKMKPRSRIKVSGSVPNHNETLTNNDGSIEREKSFIKMLIVNKETIRELRGSDLKRVGGGDAFTYSMDYKCGGSLSRTGQSLGCNAYPTKYACTGGCP